MLHTYLEFADLFRKLSPYELDHLSEILLCKLEASAEGQYFSKRQSSLNEKDIKSALTATMRDIAIEMRERMLTDAHLELDNVRSLMFTYPPAKAA